MLTKKINDLNELINRNIKTFASSASSISNLMSSSKGRDKFCALIQTTANFYIHCIKYSNIDETKAAYNSETLIDYQIGEKIKESMSKGRKIFKFLKFLQEIKGIQKNMKKKKRILYKLLIISINIMNFFYYILDNILWGISVGILSNVINKQNEKIYKDYKNQFSYMKFVLKIVKNITNLILRQRKENEIKNGMQYVDDNIITVFDDSYDLCRVLLKERRKKRFEILEIIISSMRIIPLTRSLKLPGYKWMNPVFVSFCGMLSAVLKLVFMVLNTKEEGEKPEKGKKEGSEKEDDEEDMDVEDFFNKTNKNLKSHNIRKKINSKIEKDSNLSSKSSSTHKLEVNNKLKKENNQDDKQLKNVMADFMRQTMKAKGKSGQRRVSVLSLVSDDKKGNEEDKKRTSVMSEQTLGRATRRSGVTVSPGNLGGLNQLRSQATLEAFREKEKESNSSDDGSSSESEKLLN